VDLSLGDSILRLRYVSDVSCRSGHKERAIQHNIFNVARKSGAPSPARKEPDKGHLGLVDFWFAEVWVAIFTNHASVCSAYDSRIS
jgi:hypothetical protein